MTTINYLKENRNQVIEMINNEMMKQDVRLELKTVMTQVVKYAELGCFDIVNDIEDLIQVVSDSVDTVEKERFANVLQAGTRANEMMDEQRSEIMKRFNQEN